MKRTQRSGEDRFCGALSAPIIVIRRCIFTCLTAKLAVASYVRTFEQRIEYGRA
jgi:hypothetical protein